MRSTRRHRRKGDFANIPPVPKRGRRSAFSPLLYRYSGLTKDNFNNFRYLIIMIICHDKREGSFFASAQLA